MGERETSEERENGEATHKTSLNEIASISWAERI